MKTYYVLMEREYEYNDEGYTETEGGRPIDVFEDFVEAAKAQDNKLLSHDYADVFYGMSVADPDEFDLKYPGVVTWSSKSNYGLRTYGYIASFNFANRATDEIAQILKRLHHELPIYIVEIDTQEN